MTPTWFRRPLIAGDRGDDVLIVQRLLGLPLTGELDESTRMVLRGFQRIAGIAPTGDVDAETATALGEQEGFGLLPEWWSPPAVRPGDEHWDYALKVIGAEDQDGLRRFQGNHRLPPTGVVDEETARIIAGMEVDSWGIALPRSRGGRTLSSASAGPRLRPRSPRHS